jgi:hypothetical protein
VAELDTTDVETFTGGRLSANDDNTEAVLAAALAAARRYCGWHVSPVREDDEFTLDGPGGILLSLPTRALIELSEVIEDGVTLTVANLDVSKTTGTVQKHPRARWTSRNGAIAVTMTHGYTEDQAADWRRAVLQLADSMAAEAAGQRESADLTSKKVDDVEYQWAGGILSTNDRLAAMFSAYRILPSP